MTTLEEAKAWLRARLFEGAPCPCCKQMAKVYKRPINSTMAKTLVVAWSRFGYEWFHGPSLNIKGDTGDPGLAKLRYWGLVQEENVLRPDGGRAGWWKLTSTGAEFARGNITVQKYALIYNGDLMRLEGESVSVHDALGTKFNYRDLMDGV